MLPFLLETSWKLIKHFLTARVSNAFGDGLICLRHEEKNLYRGVIFFVRVVAIIISSSSWSISYLSSSSGTSSSASFSSPNSALLLNSFFDLAGIGFRPLFVVESLVELIRVSWILFDSEFVVLLDSKSSVYWTSSCFDDVAFDDCSCCWMILCAALFFASHSDALDWRRSLLANCLLGLFIGFRILFKSFTFYLNKL